MCGFNIKNNYKLNKLLNYLAKTTTAKTKSQSHTQQGNKTKDNVIK